MRILLVLGAFLLSLQLTLSQESPTPPIVPLSPNAASLGKYGNIPIGYHTGQANVSIPLFQIDYPTFSVPITLTHNYDGLKVEEYPSWVGLGWTLQATGVITRQIRSLQDESGGGYNGQNQIGLQIAAYANAVNDGTTTPEDPSNSTLLTGIINGLTDSEPDMFFFNFPGHSGRFFFDETQCASVIKTAIVLPHQKMEVKGHFNYSTSPTGKIGWIEKFVIKDEKGIQYSFEVTEEGEEERLNNGDSGQPDEMFGNAWYLSSIIDPYGNNVTYHYKPSRTLYNPPTVQDRIILGNDHQNNPIFYYSSAGEVILDKIMFRNGMIEFIEGDERLDWDYSQWTKPPPPYATNNTVPRPRSLDKMIVTIDGNQLKEIEFGYGYLGANNGRLRLDNISEKNGSLQKKPYVFTYVEGGKIPRIGNETDLFSQDEWGYYNGTTKSTLLPSVDAELVQGQPIHFTGNSRIPDKFFSSAGLLKQVTYPTGGSTSFEYEQNDYFDNGESNGLVPFNPCAAEFTQVSSAEKRIDRSLPLTTGEFVTEESYIVHQGTCARVDGFTSVSACGQVQSSIALIRAFADPNMTGVAINEPYIRYTTTRWTEGQDTDAASLGVYNIGEEFFIQPGAYILQAIINEEDGSCDNTNLNPKISSAKIFLNLVPVSANGGVVPSNRYAGGFRVSKVMDCPAGPCSGCPTKYFQYNEILDASKSSGQLISKPTYLYEQKIRFEISNGNITTLGEVPGYVLEASSLVPVVSSSGHSIGYEYVSVLEEENGLKGRTVYNFTSAKQYPNAIYPYNPYYPPVPQVDNEWKRGVMISKKDFIGSDQSPVINQTNQNYFKTHYNKIIGLKFASKYIQEYSSQNDPFAPSDYFFKPYAIQNGWMNKQEKTTVNLEGAVAHTVFSKTQYENADHLQLTKSELQNSEGEDVVVTYKYTDDALSLGMPVEVANNPNKVAVIQVQSSRDTQLIQTKQSLYDGPYLKKVKLAIGQSALEDRVEFTTHDGYGNILSYTTRSGEIRSYRYGYDNMYPTAEAINAVPSDIFTESYEVSGGSFFTSPTDGHNMARSGRKVLQSGTYTFPTSFQPTASNMLMSYWYWDGSQWIFSGEIPYSNSISSSGTKLDEVRAYPSGALMTTYTYEPGKGVSSITDANNLTQFYEYDGLGRLAHIRDDKGNVLKSNEYFYK